MDKVDNSHDYSGSFSDVSHLSNRKYKDASDTSADCRYWENLGSGGVPLKMKMSLRGSVHWYKSKCLNCQFRP